MDVPITVLYFLLIISCQSMFAQAGNCTQKDNSTRPDCPRAIAFFRTFKSALQLGDREKIASLVSYPLSTSIHHRRTAIKDKKQLLANFDDVFDRGVRCEILGATEADVWGKYSGFTIKLGVIWFDGIIPRGEHPDSHSPDFWTKYPFKVITVNNDSYYPCASSAHSAKM